MVANVQTYGQAVLAAVRQCPHTHTHCCCFVCLLLILYPCLPSLSCFTIPFPWPPSQIVLLAISKEPRIPPDKNRGEWATLNTQQGLRLVTVCQSQITIGEENPCYGIFSVGVETDTHQAQLPEATHIRTRKEAT